MGEAVDTDVCVEVAFVRFCRVPSCLLQNLELRKRLKESDVNLALED